MSFFDFLKNLFSGGQDLSTPVATANPFSFGARPSPHDYRDVPFAAVATAEPIPSKYIEDISSLPTWYQRKIGACVGHAAGIYKVFLEWLETGKFPKLSARFLYALAKARDGFSGEGTYPRLVAKILKDHGCATEGTVPNDTTLDHETYVYDRDEKKIPAAAFTEGKKYAIKSYAFPDVKVIDELKRGIIQGRGAMLLMRVGKEWWTKKDGTSSWAGSDIVPLRPPKQIVSGHEVYLYGYEDVGGRTKFYIHNSWSLDWGINGNAWFWYDEYKQFLDEAITFVDLPNGWVEELHKLPTKESFHFLFAKTLKLGQRNNDVKQLQTALLIEGLFDAGLYRKLMEEENGLGYYGDTTRRAVLAFQTKYHVDAQPILDQLAGREVGPKTRAKLNQLYS